MDLGFKRHTSDNSLFFRNSGFALTLILIYVDDIHVTSDDASDVLQITEMLKGRFKLKHLGKVAYFLGVEVKSNEFGFVLSQRKCLNELLKKTGMDQCQPCDSPMVVNTKLSKYSGDTFDDPLMY